jgi:hypothetical protein
MTKISFGILALNAQPLLEYNLKALYTFAHQILVVEGATRAAASLATPDGHSTDDTLQMLARFKQKQDPDGKLSVISASDEGYVDGFWPEKEAMSQAYAKRITGEWLWQVDSDEFYLEEDIGAVVALLEKDPSIATISFPYIEFFGGFESTTTGIWHKYQFPLVHRVFRWGSGYQYKVHRPPTVVDEQERDLRRKNWIVGPKNSGRTILLYHYSYVFPKQARQKVGYYANVDWSDAFRDNQRWFERSYLQLANPMFLGEKGWPNLQWLERFSGRHPHQIQQLREDLVNGKLNERVRETRDIQELLSSPLYSFQRAIAGALLAVYWPIRTVWKNLRRALFGLTKA